MHNPTMQSPVVQFGKAEKQIPKLTPPRQNNVSKNVLYFAIAGLAVVLFALCSIVISSDTFASILGQNTQTSSVSFVGIPSLKTGLIIGHLIGLMLGFGVAVFLDLYLLRYLYHRNITPEVIQTALFGSKVVNVGLVLLWITGLGFIWHYQVTSPEKLANPKIWAKVTIVVLLTINGAAIHFVILKKLKSKVGSALLSNEPLPVRLGLLFSGAISAVSWTVAMGFGAIKEINNVVDASTLLGIYAGLLTLAFLALFVISNLFTNQKTAQNNIPIRAVQKTTPGLLA